MGEECEHHLGLCWFDGNATGDYWLVTQFINVSFPGVTQLTVNVTYASSGNSGSSPTATNDCSGYLRIRTYEANFIDEVGRAMKTSYTNESVGLKYSSGGVEDVMDMSGTIPLSGSHRGLYLALSADSGCIAISRLVVFFYSCPNRVIEGVIYPETLAPVGNTSTMTLGTCVGNASLSTGPNTPEQLILECNLGGQWSTASGCWCEKGYFLSNNICIGTVEQTDLLI